MFKYLFLSLCLLSGQVAAGTKFVASQCDMLGDIAGTIAQREIAGEKPENYIPELFPKLEKFPEDVTKLLKTIIVTIRVDRVLFPETANVPQAHADAMQEFCYRAGGDVATMQAGLEDFIR